MTPGGASLRAIRRHRVPAWWADAKLGIMVHWTPASVPAFAPTDAAIGDLLASGSCDALKDVPYAEWYENSLRFDDSQVARHHRATYGDRPYEAFARDFEAALEHWDPDDLARGVAASGARYVVVVAKHSDGYSLWPTAVAHPYRSRWHSERDVVGEMADATRSAGLRFGVYYCGGFDWSFSGHRVGSMSDAVLAMPRGPYPAYAEAQVRELIERYRPSVLWNDVAWPTGARALRRLMADYYRAVPDGVLNDRWMPWSPAFTAARFEPVARWIDRRSASAAAATGGLVVPTPPHFDVATREYAAVDDIQARPFEVVRGMDRSFAHNQASRPSDFLARDELLRTLVDAVAKGGNLLLNVGPRGDGAIPEAQRARLGWLGEFMATIGSVLRGTRPWVVPGSVTVEGAWLRYVARGDDVVAIVDAAEPPAAITRREVTVTPTTTVASTDGTPLRWRDATAGLTVELDRRVMPLAIVLGDVVARPVSAS